MDEDSDRKSSDRKQSKSEREKLLRTAMQSLIENANMVRDEWGIKVLRTLFAQSLFLEVCANIFFAALVALVSSFF
jgi:hypothetical protein